MNGERIERKLGDIVLRHGDTLLLQAAEGFARTFRDSADFYLCFHNISGCCLLSVEYARPFVRALGFQ